MIEKRLKVLGWKEECPSRNHHTFTKNGWICCVYNYGIVNISSPAGRIYYDCVIKEH